MNFRLFFNDSEEKRLGHVELSYLSRAGIPINTLFPSFVNSVNLCLWSVIKSSAPLEALSYMTFNKSVFAHIVPSNNVFWLSSSAREDQSESYLSTSWLWRVTFVLSTSPFSKSSITTSFARFPVAWPSLVTANRLNSSSQSHKQNEWLSSFLKTYFPLCNTLGSSYLGNISLYACEFIIVFVWAVVILTKSSENVILKALKLGLFPKAFARSKLPIYDLPSPGMHDTRIRFKVSLTINWSA